VLAGVGAAAVVAVRYWFRNDPVKEYIRKAEEVLEEHDDIEHLSLSVEDVASEAPHVSYLDGDVRVVKKKQPHHGIFRTWLVQKGKVKFGAPQRTTANVMVVRKYLVDLCEEAGLLPRHILDHVDIATHLVFEPTESELVALAIRRTEQSKNRHIVRGQLGLAAANVA
jgi:hypothetical protein